MSFTFTVPWDYVEEVILKLPLVTRKESIAEDLYGPLLRHCPECYKPFLTTTEPDKRFDRAECRKRFERPSPQRLYKLRLQML